MLEMDDLNKVDGSLFHYQPVTCFKLRVMMIGGKKDVYSAGPNN